MERQFWTRVAARAQGRGAGMTQDPSFARVLDEVPYVWRVLRRLGVRRDDWEDRTQDVLLASHERLPTFDRTRPLRPWLHGIAFHVVENQRARAHNRREVLVADVVDPIDEGPDPEQLTMERRDHDLLIRLMQGLDLDHRAVVSMHIDGIAMEDAARELNIAVPTAYKRLDTARTKLQAAVARSQRPSRTAGAMPVLLTLDALIAAERARPDDIPADVLERLRSRLHDAVRELPVGRALSLPPASPGTGASPVARIASRVLRSTSARGAHVGACAAARRRWARRRGGDVLLSHARHGALTRKGRADGALAGARQPGRVDRERHAWGERRRARVTAGSDSDSDSDGEGNHGQPRRERGGAHPDRAHGLCARQHVERPRCPEPARAQVSARRACRRSRRAPRPGGRSPAACDERGSQRAGGSVGHVASTPEVRAR